MGVFNWRSEKRAATPCAECLERRVLLSHTYPPTAAVTSGTVTTTARYAYLTVRYTGGSSPVDVTSLDGHDLVLTRRHFAPLTASLVSTATGHRGAYAVATYAVRGPGGRWIAADDGSFAAALAAKQVRDTAGRFAVSAAIGKLTVNIATSTMAAAQYTVTDLGTLAGDDHSDAHALNDAGQVVGDSEGNAFLYSNGVMHDLGNLGAPYRGGDDSATDINNAGQITGRALTDHPGLDMQLLEHAFLYANGKITDLGALDINSPSGGGAINGNGQIVGGTRVMIDGNPPTNTAFLYGGGTMTDLGSAFHGGAFGINDAGDIVGEASGHAFLYSGGKGRDLGTLGGGFESSAKSINNAGQIAGWSNTGGGNNHAFLYSDGAMRDLGTLAGATGSSAEAINDAGQIVGYASGYDGADLNIDHAFLYSNGVMRDLNSLIPANSGWKLEHAEDINAHGQIVGFGINPSGRGHAFLLTPMAATAAARSGEIARVATPQVAPLTLWPSPPTGWSAVKGALGGLDAANSIRGALSGTAAEPWAS